MAEHVTRCPKCHTSFRVTEGHLKPAKGSVRCGSCLTVFNAIDHLIVVPQKEEELALTPAQDDSEDTLISDNMGLEQSEEEAFSFEFRKNTGENKASKSSDSNLFERELIDEQETENQSIDDSWALDLIKSESEDEDEVYTPTREPKESDKDYLDPEPEPEIDYEAHYRTDKFQILEDEDDLVESISNSQHIESQFDEILYENPDIDPVEAENESQESVAPGLSAQFLDSIEPEPVEFTWRASGAWWNSNILWASLSFLAGAILFLQYAWINADRYSRDAHLRPYYVQACDLIGCQLPSISDLSKVTARNLVIRENPKAQESLVVDFILQNSALFEQNFPSIELAFTDHTNEVVAARCFKPGEYLAGELTGKTMMPVKQPIHIALEIMHPGDSALGYKIAICP